MSGKIPLSHPLIRNLFLSLLTFVAASLLFSSPGLSAQVVDGESADADPIVIAYSKQFSVSYIEAERRLLLQAEAGKLIPEIAASEPGFAGAWIEHEPEFRLIFAVAGDDDVIRLEQRVDKAFLGGPDTCCESIEDTCSFGNRARGAQISA